MTIGITGATGFIGRSLADAALRRGHEVVAFTRDPRRGVPGCAMRAFSLGAAPDVRGCDALVHLAGEPVLGVWTPAKKRRVRESRVEGTRRVREAIAAAAAEGVAPEVLVSGSAVGFYGDGGDRELTEAAPAGEGFLAEVCEAWEGEARGAEAQGRVVYLRTGVVLGKGGGALAAMTPAFRAGLGARLGNGRQWMPWIHLEDQVALTLFAVEDAAVRGPLNATAPWPVTNAEFTRTLARVVRRPAWFVAPAWALRGLGELSRELLESRRVLPAAATEGGFRFRFPELEGALRDEVGV